VGAVIATCVAIWWAWQRAEAARAAVDAADAAIEAMALDRRAGAVVLARMTDDDWLLGAQPAAAASAAGAASVVAGAPERCGVEDQAVYAEPAAADGQMQAGALVRPAGQGWVAATHRIDSALRSSADPFVQAVAVALNVGEVQTPAGRIDALVQAATTSTDPRVYALAYRTCFDAALVPGSCRLLGAQQWAALDAGNAEPWLHLFAQAVTAGDGAAQQDALVHMASSVRFETRMFAPAFAVAGLQRLAPGDQAAALSLTMQAWALQLAADSTTSALMTACRDQGGGDVERAQLCDRIGALMFDHSDAVLPEVLGARLHQMASGDSSWLQLARADEKRLRDQAMPPADATPCGGIRFHIERFALLGRIGEVRFARALASAASAPASASTSTSTTTLAPAAALSPPVPARTPARSADPASSRS